MMMGKALFVAAGVAMAGHGSQTAADEGARDAAFGRGGRLLNGRGVGSLAQRGCDRARDSPREPAAAAAGGGSASGSWRAAVRAHGSRSG